MVPNSYPSVEYDYMDVIVRMTIILGQGLGIKQPEYDGDHHSVAIVPGGSILIRIGLHMAYSFRKVSQMLAPKSPCRQLSHYWICHDGETASTRKSETP